MTVQIAGRRQSRNDGHRSLQRRHAERLEGRQASLRDKCDTAQTLYSLVSNSSPSSLADSIPASKHLSPQHPDNSISNNPLVITDELLLNFQRCKRRAFLDKYGSPANKDAISDYMKKVRQDSLTHQKNILAKHPTQTPQYPARHWHKGFEETLKLMQQGVSHIEKGVLQAICPPFIAEFGETSPYQSLNLTHIRNNGKTIILVSRPKLLIRTPGKSEFGNWFYVPADIKLGKRPKTDYQVVAALHAYLLFLIQGTWPDKSSLFLRHGNEYSVKLEEKIPQMTSVLENCVEMIVHQQEPGVFISRNRCDLCPWLSHCYDVAQSEAHLSLLPGVTPSRYTHLKNLNLTTVESLAQVSSLALASLPGFGHKTAHKLVRQAQATHHSKALKLLPGPENKKHPPLQEWIPTAPIELYFDIEAAPERELIYLHGVVVVDRNANTNKFYGLMAEYPDEEAAIWQQFLDLTARHPTAPIFHFCPYEAHTVKKLGAAYQTPEYITDALLKRFVDLHDRVVHAATMPIESYALKAIAKWIGFKWRDSEANGAQSIFWYDQWLETDDRTYLDRILQYNEDDCLATWKVKDWLINFLKTD
ncbi:MAG: TM0106 family RecB-like putative nuclease [Cyanobacteria bacterium P01_F01_bin.150]